MRACPLCGGPGAGWAFPYATVWNGKRFGYFACRDCPTTYVDPVPSSEDFAAMYAKENYHDVHYRVPDSRPAARSLARVRPYLGQCRSILDFACGMGGFLIGAKAAGLDAFGVEYDPDVRKAAQANSGCPVVALEEVEKSQTTFDVIHLGDVLEHLPEPKPLMLRLQGLLKPGGVFFAEGPLQRNASLVYWSSAGFKMIRRGLGIDRDGSAPPTHLLLSDRNSQRRFFTDAVGLECRFYEIEESGWPYLAETEGWARRADPLVRHLIALAAIQLSRVNTRRCGVFGNRFIGIFQPRPAGDGR